MTTRSDASDVPSAWERVETSPIETELAASLPERNADSMTPRADASSVKSCMVRALKLPLTSTDGPEKKAEVAPFVSACPDVGLAVFVDVA